MTVLCLSSSPNALPPTFRGMHVLLQLDEHLGRVLPSVSGAGVGAGLGTQGQGQPGMGAEAGAGIAAGTAAVAGVVAGGEGGTGGRAGAVTGAGEGIGAGEGVLVRALPVTSLVTEMVEVVRQQVRGFGGKHEERK